MVNRLSRILAKITNNMKEKEHLVDSHQRENETIILEMEYDPRR